MADQAKLTWGEVDGAFQGGEGFSQQDAAAAESLGKVPPGKYICTCVDSAPRQVNPPGGSSFFEANLKWRIDSCVEIGGKSVVGTDATSQYEGRFIFDGIRLQTRDEKESFKSRRLLIAKRLGAIGMNDTAIPPKFWSEGIINRRAMITTEKSTYNDKVTGEPKSNVRVGFGGYDTVAKAADMVANGSALDGI